MTQSPDVRMDGWYRKKPVVVEAWQWTGQSRPKWPAWLNATQIKDRGAVVELLIVTLEGDMKALRGDWIIRGIKGELYPCKPDIFAATYELASAPSPLQDARNEALDRNRLRKQMESLLYQFSEDDDALLDALVVLFESRPNIPPVDEDVKERAAIIICGQLFGHDETDDGKFPLTPFAQAKKAAGFLAAAGLLTETRPVPDKHALGSIEETTREAYGIWRGNYRGDYPPPPHWEKLNDRTREEYCHIIALGIELSSAGLLRSKP